MQPETTPTAADVLIVGTGIAALAAAERLHSAGKSVVLVDKARGVGGRMATRRLSEGNCDHGVPSFRVEGEDFRHATHPWLKEGVAKTWTRGAGIADIVGTPGMTAIAKAMARPLPSVHLDAKIDKLSVHDNHWTAEGVGRRYVTRSVLLSPPVPQTLALLDTGSVGLVLSDSATLQAIRYWPTFVVLARFACDYALPAPGWVSFEKHAKLLTIVDDRRKGASPIATATIRSTADYAEKHFEKSDEAVLAELLAAAAPHLSGPPVETEIHRWRFATVREGAAPPWLLLKGTPPAYCIGDAFGGGSIEGAWRSGRAAAEHLLAGGHSS